MDSLYIVMPAYNEEANISEVVDSWYPLLDGKSKQSRLVIADSGSTDSTHKILISMQKEYPQLIILSNTLKQHGPKVIALYEYAIKNNVDYVFQTDSDGQTSPSEFHIFWKYRHKYSAIFGNRVNRQDGENRIFVEKIVCVLLKLFFGISIPDANAPFRLMKTTKLQKYLFRLPKDYNLPNIMVTTYFAYYSEKVVFRKISFKSRQGGINSINLLKIFCIGCKALVDFYHFRKQMD